MERNVSIFGMTQNPISSCLLFAPYVLTCSSPRGIGPGPNESKHTPRVSQQVYAKDAVTGAEAADPTGLPLGQEVRNTLFAL